MNQQVSAHPLCSWIHSWQFTPEPARLDAQQDPFASTAREHPGSTQSSEGDAWAQALHSRRLVRLAAALLWLRVVKALALRSQGVPGVKKAGGVGSLKRGPHRAGKVSGFESGPA